MIKVQGLPSEVVTKASTVTSLRSIGFGGLVSLCLAANVLLPRDSTELAAAAVYSRLPLVRTGVCRPYQPCALNSLDQETTLLRSGETLTRPIDGGKTQSFSISVAAGQYLRLLVRQHGIILTATLVDVDGRLLSVMENPSGGHGPIEIAAIATAPGNYRLEVHSTEDWANPGSFDLSIAELRDARSEDGPRVKAERAFGDGSRKNEAGLSEVAIERYQASLSYWQSVSDRHWEALTKYALGQAYRSGGNRKKAVECFNEALNVLATKIDESDWRLEAATLNDLGLLYRGIDNDKAIAALKQALSKFEGRNDRRGQGSSLNGLAITYGQMGQLHLARELAERALPLRRQENFRTGEINVLNTLGNIDDRLGDSYRARGRFTSALKVWQELAREKPSQSQAGLANAFNSLALANDRLGDWDEALHDYEEALKILSTRTSNRAATLDNEGELYNALGDLDRAKARYDEAIAILDSLDSPPDLRASVLLHLGQLSALTGNLKESLDYFNRARDAKPNEPKLAYVLTNIGAALAIQGASGKALEAYQEALAIQLKIEDRRGEAITRQKIAGTYISIGRAPEAHNEFNLALNGMRAVMDRPGEAVVLNGIAILMRDQNDLQRALELNKQAIQIIETLRAKVSSHQLRTSYFASQESYYESNVDFNMTLFQRDHQTERLADALAANERSRARTLMDMLAEDRLRIGAGSGDELLRAGNEVHQKVRAKFEAQTALLSSKHTETEAVAIAKELSQMLTQEDEIESRIRSENPKYSELIQPRILAVNELQQQLDGSTVLLEYSLGNPRSYVWAATSNSIDGFQLQSRDVVEAAANRITKSLADRNRTVNGETAAQWDRRRRQADKDFDAASAELSNLVISRVAPLLGNKRLVIVADGALQLVSFAALPLPRAGAQQSRRLIDDHEIVYEPSGSVLAFQRSELGNRQPAPRAVAILADPVFNKDDARVVSALPRINPPRNGPNSNGSAGGENATRRREVSRALEDIGLERFPRLNSSASEAKRIIAAAPKGDNKEALGFDASRETATSAALSSYRIVHFATHAVVNYEHPELSGIVLSLVDRTGQPQDGYLRLHDIYNLNLPADLVVLSACQTGVGKEIKGEGLIALTRGFMYAGAQRVVASLWKVDDVATSNLMAEFYKQMFVSGQRPAAALRAAQLSLAKKHSPADWAGFVLQGEWK